MASFGCQSEHYFVRLAEACEIVSAWRKDCNEVRPQSMLGRFALAEFAARLHEVSTEELHVVTEGFAN